MATDGPRSPGRRQWPEPASDGGADGQRRAALAALGLLTATERACVELRLIRRMPIDEVAAALGLTVADARAILLRALRKVASALEVQPNAAG